ncbi:hypothetical protein Hanom_Chr02g00096211 [Helianthus anomalus]
MNFSGFRGLSPVIKITSPEGVWISTAFLSHKIRAWLAINQSIPSTTSNPAKFIGNRFAENLWPNSSIFPSCQTLFMFTEFPSAVSTVKICLIVVKGNLRA